MSDKAPDLGALLYQGVNVIYHHPKKGEVLICDFSRGFVEPEMLKVRPIVVITGAERHKARLCTVVPLSTTPPNPVLDWHVLIRDNPIAHQPHAQVWAKCDMLYTVSYDRLDKMHIKARGGRQYISKKIHADDMANIMSAVACFLKIIDMG